MGGELLARPYDAEALTSRSITVRLAVVLVLLLCSVCGADEPSNIEIHKPRGFVDDMVLMQIDKEEGEDTIHVTGHFELSHRGTYNVICYYTSFDKAGKVVGRYMQKQEAKSSIRLDKWPTIVYALSTTANRLNRKKLKIGKSYLVVVLVVYKDAIIDCHKYRLEH